MRRSIALFALLGLLNSSGKANAETITGYIYCDNQFTFYFNGKLIAKDPLDFTPHNAVKVSFEYDGTSAKTYAIACSDYASASGYEYTGTDKPQLGDGALIAKFSDGTVTDANWKQYVVTHGPTDASTAAGCSASNLAPCVVQDNGAPSEWYMPSFDDAAWSAAKTYTAEEAGWGRTPEWKNGKCCTSTSPITRGDLGCNVDSKGNAITVTQDECIAPKTVLDGDCTSFIWSSDLDRDNKVLFRYTAAAGSGGNGEGECAAGSANGSGSATSGAMRASLFGLF
eukprot:GDKI01047018.1.p2 GENE.GDKI01047018.1~~GDKI01047018.1.p2  ORF type:complete len:283 (-),score=90.42 GDKI01047018.1:331-1179(-)